jgi:hypothetical protein
MNLMILNNQMFSLIMNQIGLVIFKTPLTINLMEKFSMLRSTNLKIVKDVKNLELERDNLLKDLSDSYAVCNTHQFENDVLIANNKSLQNDLF